MPTIAPDPSGLVTRCLAGDDAARAEFINFYGPLIERAVARCLNGYRPRGAFSGEMEDIVHEVYLKLFARDCRALESVRSARSLDAWLVTVAQNHTVSYMRKRLALGQADEASVGRSAVPRDQAPDHAAIDSEVRHRVRAAIDRLDDKDRLVLQLYYLHNQRYADIAQLLDMNINTVASRLMRAKIKIRELLAETET